MICLHEFTLETNDIEEYHFGYAFLYIYNKKTRSQKELCNGLKFEPAHLFLLSEYDPVVEKESILI